MQRKILMSIVLVLGIVLVASPSGGTERPTSQDVQQQLAKIRAVYP